MTIQAAETDRAALTCWLVEPYGAPTSSSEVSRVEGFYSATALMAFGAPALADAAPAEDIAESLMAAAEGVLDQIAEAAQALVGVPVVEPRPATA